MALAGCSNSTGPEDRGLRVGRYAYSSVAGTGTLRITYASADSVAGVWDVASGSAVMAGATSLGFWNQDAYVVYGTQRNGNFSTTYAHRIGPSGCTVRIPLSGEPVRPCTVTYQGN